ncbi:MAG: TolC family protein, partial [Campylobacterota bacterium]|nr:TolC family protein [Campylobacterota bacterium]
YKTAKTKARPGEDDEPNKYFEDTSYNLTLRQNIYSGGATQTEIKAFEKKYEVSKNKYRLEITKEVGNAIKSYLDVLFNYKSLKVNIENMQRLKEVLEIVTIKYDSGAASIGDISSIKANVANAQSSLIKVQSKFNESLDFYKYIVGESFVSTFPYQDDFDTSIGDFEDIIEKAIQHNKNVQNYRLNIQAEKYKLQNAKAPFRPKVDFELSANRITDKEDYEYDEDAFKAQLSVTYNFYNKGKDRNKFLKIHSNIRELEYRLEEEIRKLKWNLSKLHTSVVSLINATKSTKEEVSASNEMVDAYWEAFKEGEQDLQVLLQAQRQLNGAQLELIKSKKSSFSDYFKILSHSGDILKYFKLDIESPDFIDFTYSDYKKTLEDTPTVKDAAKDILTKELESLENTVTQELNTTIEDQNNTLVEDINLSSKSEEKPDINKTRVSNSLKELLGFEDKFLNADEEKWTIKISYFDKTYEALDFGLENNISKDMFIFDSLVDNKIKQGIAYNIFDTKDMAQELINEINTTLSKQSVQIKSIKDIQRKLKGEKLIVKTKPKKKIPFSTNKQFKEKFLDAPKEFYTINVTSLSSMQDAQKLLKKENIYSESLVFTYGEEKRWVKLVYGVFKTYEEAFEALISNLDNIKSKYDPVIEKIEQKQELYKTYHPSESLLEDTNTITPVEIEETLQEELEAEPEQITDINNTVEIIEIEGIKQEETVNDINITDTNLTQRSENIDYVSDDNSSFKERFLEASRDHFSINLATLDNMEQVREFEQQEDMSDVIIFKLSDETEDHKVFKGIFETYTEAMNGIENLNYNLKASNPYVSKIGPKQDMYHKYNSQMETENIILDSIEENLSIEQNVTIEEKVEVEDILYSKNNLDINNTVEIIEIEGIKQEETVNDINITDTNLTQRSENIDYVSDDNSSFKERFLEASRDHFSINLATLDNMEQVREFEQQEDMSDVIIFKLSDETEDHKVFKGIFETYTEAMNGIENLNYNLKASNPYVSKIGPKQDMYHKYNSQTETLDLNQTQEELIYLEGVNYEQNVTKQKELEVEPEKITDIENKTDKLLEIDEPIEEISFLDSVVADENNIT